MQKVITISRDELLQNIKISCQIPTFIESIVTAKIITSAAASAGIHVESAELQQAADNFRLANNLLQAGDTWSWLQKYHLSLDDFETLVYANALSEKLAHHLFADKVESWFYKHQLDYAGAIIYEIIFQDEDLALENFYALQEGEVNYPEVARQHIQEPTLRRCWGYRGLVRRSELKPEISAAVFASTPPQTLKPIVVSQGVHLILVEELIKPHLSQQLQIQILSELFSNWLQQQREQVEVAIDLESHSSINSILSAS